MGIFNPPDVACGPPVDDALEGEVLMKWVFQDLSQKAAEKNSAGLSPALTGLTVSRSRQLCVGTGSGEKTARHRL